MGLSTMCTESRGACQSHEEGELLPPTLGAHGRYQNPYGDAYFRALHEVKGVPKVDDLVNYRVGHGCGYLVSGSVPIWADHQPKFISRKGVRSNTTHIYLYERGHLAPTSRVRILQNLTVNRVIFQGDTAAGLEVVDTPRGPLNDAQPAVRRKVVKARRTVILAGGAFGSPMILERSGIGGREHLEGLGIAVKVDLPGVGAEYQDHEVSSAMRVKLTDSSQSAAIGSAMRQRHWMIMLGEGPRGRLRIESGPRREQGEPQRMALVSVSSPSW